MGLEMLHTVEWSSVLLAQPDTGNKYFYLLSRTALPIRQLLYQLFFVCLFGQCATVSATVCALVQLCFVHPLPRPGGTFSPGRPRHSLVPTTLRVQIAE